MSARLLLLPLLLAACARPLPPAVAPATGLIPAQAMRADLDFLYRSLESAHYDLFAHRSRAEYDRLHEELRASIESPVSARDAARIVQRFLAYGNVGHARTDAVFAEFGRYRAAGGTMIPLFLRVDDGRVSLVRAATLDGRPAAGSEVVRVGGEPALEWLDAMSVWVSAERPYMEHAQLERMLPIAIWLESGAIESLRIETRATDGGVIAADVPALAPDEFRALMAKHPAPGPNVDFDTREVSILENGIAWLRPGPFANIETPPAGPAPSYEDSAYRRFLDDAFAKILEAGTEDLVIDLRNNSGGDNSFSDAMIAWFADAPFRFPSRFMLKASAETKAWYAKLQQEDNFKPDAILARLIAEEQAHANGTRYPFEIAMVEPRPEPRYHGRVHVLVNRHSYSNAASAAALIQDYGFGRIYGEETADVPTTYASVLYFDLPNSGITVTYPKSYIVRPNGDERVRGVVPDVVIDATPSADDAVRRRLLEHLRAKL